MSSLRIAYRSETGEAVLAIQKISRPPRLSDFRTLSFPEEDLDDLAKCRVGKCTVKVDEPDLERLHREVDWSAPNAHEQANRVIRQMAVEGWNATWQEAIGFCPWRIPRRVPTIGRRARPNCLGCGMLK